MTDREFEELQAWVGRKTKELERGLNQLRGKDRGMSKEEIRKRLSIQDDETLKWISTDIVLPNEDMRFAKRPKIY
jgi:dephospho-CoA kinase